MSSLTFLMSLLMLLRFSGVAVPSLGTKLPCLSQKRFQALRRKRAQPSMPLLSQGLLMLMGPRNIS